MNSKVVYLKDYRKEVSLKDTDLKRLEMRKKMRIKISEKSKKRK